MAPAKAACNSNQITNRAIELSIKKKMAKAILNRIKAGDLELKEKVVAINRVVKTTKGGRTFSFSALVVVGNEQGVVGHGLGKAKEVQEAITKGIEDAKKNLIKVPVMHGTIPHDQLSRVGAAKVLIKPAAHGTGVIAGGSMRAVLESAGITDVLAKSLGSANPHNVVKATFEALAMLREPINVARQRNVNLKKVFNG
jgi:small subunit ribosomal protein S5